MSKPPVYSVGYGNRPAAETIRLVLESGCLFLIDVRSSPYSRFAPEYNREELEQACRKAHLKYVFMGEQLGGRPQSQECYDPDGKVNYQKMETDPEFLTGIGRLEKAISQGLQVAVMCSELRPEDCHRAKLIGKVLSDRGLEVRHLDADGAVVDQDHVLCRVTGGQSDFFGDPAVSRSRGSYKTR